jgi:bifunctional UDP-N-acetylglucosamine pyrophosphorylase/glucosamine-1-phosphate N-acetyltransferase
MSDRHVVVLAAGRGTRMKSDLPKVLHPVAGRALIDRVLDTAAALTPATTTLVVGHGADVVREHLAGHPGLGFAVQDPPLGTAHALQQAEGALAGRAGTVVLLSGDVPLLCASTLDQLLDAHRAAGAAATVLTGVLERPYGYGRIVRDAGGAIVRIVEERDTTRSERDIHEINSGIWAFDLVPLFDALRAIASQNAQGEFYLTDLVGIYRRRGAPVATLTLDDPQEIRGINSRTELAEVSRIVRQQKNEELMAAGVTIIDPATTYIDDGVEVGADTVIHPGVVLEGRTRVGAACEIQGWVRIHDSEVGDRVTVRNFSVLAGARVDAGATVGPFAHLRPESVVGEGARVGNFVELKKTTLGPGSKANHLAYLGDATIGAGVNVGAGAITCNYDGAAKHQTLVEDGAFIGSDVQLVAPVRVGEGAYVGSGTTVREDVPAGALAVSAGPQRNIEGWAARRAQKPKD